MEQKKQDTNLLGRAAKLIASCQRKHPVWSFILVKSPGVWFTFLYSLIGSTLGLLQTTEEGNVYLTGRGALILLIMAVFVFVGNISLIYDERTNGEFEELKSNLKDERENSAVLTDLNNSAYSICETKLRTLTACLGSYLEDPAQIPPEIISDPNRQLDVIANNLSEKIGRLLGFNRRRRGNDSLYTSIIYRFPQENEHEWICATPQRGLPVDALLAGKEGKQSTFSFLIENKGHIVFRNSKQVAYEKGHYIPDDEDVLDQDDKLKGSIACFQHKIMAHNKVIVDFVITITSYNRKFVENETDASDVIRVLKENIDDIFMPDFVVRAKIELCLLYLKQLSTIRRQGIAQLVHTSGDYVEDHINS